MLQQYWGEKEAADESFFSITTRISLIQFSDAALILYTKK